jgi:putative transposase
MPRQSRNAPGGYVYHVLNRANGRLRLFRKDDDFLAFERVLAEAMGRVPTRLLGWCVMGNHWHLALWPRTDGELSAFVRWLTHTHVQRWHAAHGTSGTGHVYQGRFKSFPVESDEHLLTLMRYIHRNPLRAGLVKRAEGWRWSSLWAERSGTAEQRALLHAWPVDRPQRWLALVNRPQSEAEEAAVQESIRRSRPLGSAAWVKPTVKRLNLQWTMRPRGRPVKELHPR